MQILIRVTYTFLYFTNVSMCLTCHCKISKQQTYSEKNKLKVLEDIFVSSMAPRDVIQLTKTVNND